MRAERESGGRRLTLALTTVVAAAAMAAGAIAQDPSPIDPGPLPDTEFTPTAKDVAEGTWEQVAGARYPAESKPDGSFTPPTVDFHTVAFANSENGFAGGSACENESCQTRVPVIWRYEVPPGGSGQWREVFRGDEPGYVGALAYVQNDPGRAIAVGGTGKYPRRELPRKEGESDSAYALRDVTEGAGLGRIWTFDGGDWSRSAEAVPADSAGNQMRGLTAIDCTPRLTEGELCLAGGLQQVWTWKDGAVLKGFSPTKKAEDGTQNPNPDIEGAVGFRYRVRQIRFTPGNPASKVPALPAAVAMTSGCCAENEAGNQPRALLFDGTKWAVRLLVNDPDLAAFDSPVNAPDAVDDAVGDQSGTIRDTHKVRALPDSLYSFVFTKDQRAGDTSNLMSVVAAPGNPNGIADTGHEAESTILGRIKLEATYQRRPAGLTGGESIARGTVALVTDLYASGCGCDADATQGMTAEVVTPRISDLRLMAGGGDFAGPPDRNPQSDPLNRTPSAADGVLDWAVGELRSTHQGAAYTTLDPIQNLPGESFACPESAGVLGGQPVDYTKCQPDQVEGTPDKLESSRLVKLSSWSLNALTFVPGSAVGWAVGDKGAIVRYGQGGALGGATSEPGAPRLGAKSMSALPDNSAYDGFRPLSLSGRPGVVPPLANRSLQGGAPRLVPSGSPDSSRPMGVPQEDVRSIVMSRDGSEGWALGAGHALTDKLGLTLYHYDGERWTSCDPLGVKDQLEPDPACAGLAGLLSRDSSGSTVSFSAATRVPLEKHDDRSLHDEFEVIAVGTKYTPPSGTAAPVVARYRGGRWGLDRDAMEALAGTAVPTSVAFTAPDDGWILTGTSSALELFHLDRDGWTRCSQDRPGCFDTSAQPQLPLGGGSSKSLFVKATGETVYVAGTRTSASGAASGAAAAGNLTATYPLILSHKRGEPGWEPELDPAGSGSAGPADEGHVDGLSVVETPEGLRGWATGVFGTLPTETAPSAGSFVTGVAGSGPGDLVRRNRDSAPLLALGEGGWAKWPGAKTPASSAAEDYLYRSDFGRDRPFEPLALPGGSAVVAGTPKGRLLATGSPRSIGPLLRFDPAASDWAVLPAPFLLQPFSGVPNWTQAAPRALAPDGKGGFWLAVRQTGMPGIDPATGRTSQASIAFYHYTGQQREPVFDDIAHPVRETITAAAGGADGTFWVGTASNGLYRYDRVTGWDRVGIKGWDPGRLVTNPSPINAVAVGPDGKGLAVGRGGRIANLTSVGAILDGAAGVRCRDVDGGACGTGRDLRAAAVASDGSAMVGGDERALLWRPAGGEFRAINPPATASNARITGIAMPTPGQAWLTTDLGQVYSATAGSGWSWALEAADKKGRPLTIDPDGNPQALRGIAIDSGGKGFAVGDRGIVLQRTADGWKRLVTGFRDDLRAVALPAGGVGEGALVGGVGGVILTYSEGRFQVARPGDFWDPLMAGKGVQKSGRIMGLAITSGTSDGQVEAWAASQVPTGDQTREAPPGAVFHYTSNPDDPLLNPEARATPLPDTPAPRPGEISFAAFGRSDCRSATTCPELMGSNLVNDVVAGRVAEEIAAASKRPGGPQFAVFTGDVSHASGRDRSSSDDPASVDNPLDNNVIHRRWSELIAGRLRSAGVPLFGALGAQDLSQAQSCNSTGTCVGTRQQAKAGTSLPWRQIMAGMPAPWGSGKAESHRGVVFQPVEDAVEPMPNPDGGGARTHYAADVIAGGKAVARLVVVDSSLRSLEAGKANQNPVEKGTQLDWLDRMLSTRPAGAQAIVVSNTPTYSYGPPAVSDTQTDATTFESILFKNRANVVVSGRLGWNGLYWATAPGLHFPCPGGSYPDQQTETPAPGSAPNCSGTGQESAANTDAATQRVAEALRGLGAPPPPEAVSNLIPDTSATGLLPQVVAATAGGTFGPDGQGGGSASEGYWQGYTVIRVAPAGEGANDYRPDQTIVEQRPVFDWIGMSAVSHRLAPGQKLTLRGYGREPVGMDAPPRYDVIDSPAITHRYDLVEADPQRPYLPRRDADGEYVKLDPSVGSVDPVTGRVTTGKGSHPRVFAVALLSVGSKAATWPIVFEPRASYRPPALNIIKPAIPAVPPRPPITVLSTGVSSLPSTPPPAPPPPIGNLSLNFPPPPAIPGMPPLNTAPINPPTPPVPPPPPASVAPSALELLATPVGLNVPPQTSPIPPPSPPIQPAPPGGARKEARQRQAAVAKSEEGSGEGAGEGESSGENGSSQSYTRHDVEREPLAFTAVARHEQPSAWARGLTYGGGITLMAFLLSTTWLVARPRHRRREPTVPAPVWVRDQRRDG